MQTGGGLWYTVMCGPTEIPVFFSFVDEVRGLAWTSKLNGRR